MPNKLLFDDDDSGDEANKDNKLEINKDYADKYGKWRQKEDYERLKAKYGVKDFDSENSDSEESEDEEYVEPDNPEFDMDFYRVLAAIRTKHPILEEKEKFFKDSYQSKIRNKEEKPLSIGEYERKRLLDRERKCDDDDIMKQGPSGLVKENKDLGNSKKNFKFDDNLSDDDDGEDLFKKKESDDNNEEVEEIDNEAVEFLKGKKKELNNKLDEELLSSLKTDWQKNMSKEDKFLMDYFVNKRYLEDENEEKERADNHYILDFEPLEDDEETFNKMEEYETKYRFRFEEPDKEFIHRHPRVINDSVRLKDNKRKEERDKKKDKIKEEEERKKQELLRLKALKRQEIMNRIEMLKEVAGIQDELNPDNFDLEADFDPEQHDKLMSEVFNENYYNEEAETEKPKFEDEELQRELEEEYEKLKELDNMAEGTFRYVDVVPNSYGLETEEILFAKDTELNRWYSINRILKHGQRETDEMRVKKNFDRRAANDEIKLKILPSLYSENIVESWEAEEERKRKRNLKKKERKRRKMLQLEGEAVTDSSKIELENCDDSNIENLSDTKGKQNGNFEKEKLSTTDSIGDETENEHSFSNYYDELSENKSNFKEDIKLSENKKKKKKQQVDDSITTIENCFEGDNSIESINKSSEEENKKLNESMGKNIQNKKKRKKVNNNTEKTENSVSNSNNNITLNKDSEKNIEFSKANCQEKGKQNNSVQSPTKNKKKRKFPENKNNSEDQNKSNKKRKLSEDKFEKKNHLKGISDVRLLAYGQNPKKIRKTLKYSNKILL